MVPYAGAKMLAAVSRRYDTISVHANPEGKLVDMTPGKFLSRAVLARMVADVLLINVALMAALGARLLAFLWLRTSPAMPHTVLLRSMLRDSAVTYAGTAPILTVFSLVIFTAFGIYSHGRAYQGRWKLLIIVQAVTLSYLALGAGSYLLTKVLIWLPRTVWLVGLFLTLALVTAARLWGRLWLVLARLDPSRSATTRQDVRNVLVIGGAGYIGSILVRKLLDRGYRVKVLDALVYGDEGIRELHGRSNFELIQADFRNVESVVQALQDTDAVFHLGALVGDPACGLNEKLTLEINLAATRMIAEAARGFGIQRFIFASTCSVYGASENMADERSSLHPVSLYARSKIEAERALLALVGDGFAPTILRFATIFGLSPRPRFDLVINILAARATREKRITIFGGDQWRPFIHVDDVASALLRCLEAPILTVKGQIYNVGADEQNYRIRDVGAKVKELLPDTQVDQRGQDVDPRNYRVSFAKIRRELGFHATHTVDDGIREIRDAVASGKIGNLDDVRYSNFALLSESGAEVLIRQSRLSAIYGNWELDDQAMPVPSAVGT